jgi:hypothetical protein
MGKAGTHDPLGLAAQVVDDSMRLLVQRTGDGELTVGAALAATAAIREAADQKLFQLVGFARDQGASWAQIGEALGVSTQAAHQRYGPKPPTRNTAS